MKKVIKVVGAAAVVAGVFALGTQLFNPAPVVSKGTVYSGKLYVAGHGGHIAVAERPDRPHGRKADHHHEPRPHRDRHPEDPPLPRRADRRGEPRPALLQHLQARPERQAARRVGRPQGREGHQGHVLDPDARSTGTAASPAPTTALPARRKDFYFPVTMAYEGYIDVIDKKTMDHEAPGLRRLARRQVRLPVHARQHLARHEDLPARGQQGQRHPEGGLGHHRRAGALPARQRRRSRRASSRSSSRRRSPAATPKSTITFRQYFTPDGKYILQSANDMFYVIDAKDARRSWPRRTARTA